MASGALIFDFHSLDTPAWALQRRLFEAYVMVECAWANVVWARYIAHVESISHPLGLARHLPLDFMLDGRAPWVNAAVIGCLLALGFARRLRFAYAAALVLMLVQYAARYSIGEIPHGANLIGMCLLGFGLAPLLYAERRQADQFALGFMWMAIGLGYTSAAACKLIASGISWPLGEHLSLWIYNKATDSFAKTGQFQLDMLQQFLVEHRWAGTLFLCAGLATELGSGLIVFPRLRPWVLWAIVGLHLGIGVVLEIWFRSATAALALLALPPAPFRWLAEKLMPPARRPSDRASLQGAAYGER